MTIIHSDFVRFWSRVETRSEDECWLWRGNLWPNGYGRFSIGARSLKAHRVALEMALGRELDGLALHSCDNPPCVNPAHLREGTHADNSADMVARDRNARMKGETNPRAVLSHHGVLAVREMVAAGRTQKDVAEEMGVSTALVSMIVNRKRWAHV